MNNKVIQGLFKPYKKENKKSIGESFIELVGEREFWKIQFEQECSKSIDESCINADCHYNFLNSHEDELYIDLRKELDDYWLEVEKRNNTYKNGDVNA